MNTLSYIAIAGYKPEQISYAKAKSDRAREAAATGVLSASIAHELNQPLGASNLNSQFLKMKPERGAPNLGPGKEALDSLEEENKRAVTIVEPLWPIFTEGESNAQVVVLADSAPCC